MLRALCLKFAGAKYEFRVRLIIFSGVATEYVSCVTCVG